MKGVRKMKKKSTSTLEKDRILLAEQILRRIKNCSQFERDFGVTRNELLNIQKCETDPKLSTLSRISEGLGCTTAELLLPGDLTFDEIIFLISILDRTVILECYGQILNGYDRLISYVDSLRKLFRQQQME